MPYNPLSQTNGAMTIAISHHQIAQQVSVAAVMALHLGLLLHQDPLLATTTALTRVAPTHAEAGQST